MVGHKREYCTKHSCFFDFVLDGMPMQHCTQCSREEIAGKRSGKVDLVKGPTSIKAGDVLLCMQRHKVARFNRDIVEGEVLEASALEGLQAAAIATGTPLTCQECSYQFGPSQTWTVERVSMNQVEHVTVPGWGLGEESQKEEIQPGMLVRCRIDKKIRVVKKVRKDQLQMLSMYNAPVNDFPDKYEPALLSKAEIEPFIKVYRDHFGEDPVIVQSWVDPDTGCFNTREWTPDNYNGPDAVRPTDKGIGATLGFNFKPYKRS